MALYILVVFLVVLAATALLIHYGFAFAGLLPDIDAAHAAGHGHGHGGLFSEPVLASVRLLALVWLAIGGGLVAFGYGG